MFTAEDTFKTHRDLLTLPARPRFHNLTQVYQGKMFVHILLDHLPFPALLGLGAIICTYASTFEGIPGPYAVAGLLLAIGYARPLAVALGLWPNRQKEASFPGTWHAHVPRAKLRVDGKGWENPEFVVMLFGAKDHGPLGTLSGLRGKNLSDAMYHIFREMESDPKSGLIGLESLRGTDTLSNNTVFYLAYFRSMKDVRNFTQTQLHKSYWLREYSASEEMQSRLELWHEVFQVKENGYSDLRLNATPFGMGRTWEKTEDNDEGDGEKWRSVLRPGLRRMPNSWEGKKETLLARLRGKVPMVASSVVLATEVYCSIILAASFVNLALPTSFHSAAGPAIFLVSFFLFYSRGSTCNTILNMQLSTFTFSLLMLVSLARSAPIPVSEEQAVAMSSGGNLLKRASCYYVGTFFQLIDCNAPADSTEIPWAPVATPTL